MDNSRADQIAWIKSILDVSGWTPTELARRAGIAQTTLTRFLHDSQTKATLHARTVARIAEATGWQPSQAATPGNRAPVAQFGDVVEVPHTEILRDEMEAALRGFMAGRNAAFPRLVRSRALENAGYLPGDIVVIDQNERARRGDVVAATVDASGESPGSRPESVLRIFEPPYLIAATLDGALRRPLYVDEDRVQILGVVIGLFRPRLAA